ncbi:MAG TPA: hypothetical protein VK705_06505 [Ferruginibacter sp.]|jgi:hypothetical protein|nr:hypothetical protein [Ferruginibacter sp.]
MKDIIYQEAKTTDARIKVGILIYTGAGDPVKHLNDAVSQYVGQEGYNEFIDANMDNPWVRVIIKGINDMEQVEFKPEIHHL